MKKNAKPFEAPESYFDNLPGRIEKRAESRASRNQRFLPGAIAASFILLLATSMVLLLTHYPTNIDISAMADLNHAENAEDIFYNEFSLTETSLNPSTGIIDWDNLFNESILNDVSPHEIAEYIFEQEELNF